MRNLRRAAAMCALTLTALSTVEAATYGKCNVRCFPSSGPAGATSISFTTTQQECCQGDVSQYCPPGYSGAALSWNGTRCGF